MWQTDTVREGLDQIPDTKARAIAGQLKQRLAALYGDRLVHVILYGSRARGDYRPYSDVDVLVVLKGPIDGRTERERTLDAVAELSLKHDTVVHRELLRENGYFDEAVSRAYYAMFYVASALLAAEGLEFRSHSAVIAEFGRVFAKTGRVPVEFHRFLIDAESERLEGDYHWGSPASLETAETLIERAREFVALGSRILLT